MFVDWPCSATAKSGFALQDAKPSELPGTRDFCEVNVSKEMPLLLRP